MGDLTPDAGTLAIPGVSEAFTQQATMNNCFLPADEAGQTLYLTRGCESLFPRVSYICLHFAAVKGDFRLDAARENHGLSLVSGLTGNRFGGGICQRAMINGTF